MSKTLHLDIPRIYESLDEVQKNFRVINPQLMVLREEFTKKLKDNMVSAYTHLDSVIGMKPFSGEGLTHMLELNHLVLCGSDLETRTEYQRHIGETRKKFSALVPPLQKWYHKHRDDNPVKVAAEMYVGILSQPQLYIEGNHRTGSLVASWILMNGGYPPFVLNSKNAVAYFNPSSEIKFSDKRRFGDKLKLPKYKKRFKHFLEEMTSKKYLLKKD